MFLLQLSSCTPPLRALPSFCWTRSRSNAASSHLPYYLPTPPHPWPPPPISRRGLPPRPVLGVRTAPPVSISAAFPLGGSCSSFHTSAGSMEFPGQDPPRKRIRSEEQRRGSGPPPRGPAGGRNQESSRDQCAGLDLRGSRTPPPKTYPSAGGLVGGQRSGVGPAGPWRHRVLQRYWETCSSEPPPLGGSTAFHFTVMSYNILSQQLLEDNAFLYRHCPPAVLSWDHRLPNLLSEIQHLHPDVLCLQEVQEDHYDNQIKAALQALGYRCEYKKRTGQKPDGCAVAFKASRFHLLSSNPVEFFRAGDPLLDRDNVGLVVLLQPADGRSGSPPICVANTHLLYNPKRGDIKLTQLAILLAEVQRLSRLPDGSACPVLLCGDFNSAPWSPLYTFLTRGCLEYQGMQIGMVSGQEPSPRGQRFLPLPLWPPSLGISHRCRYEAASSGESDPGHVTCGVSPHGGEADGRGSSVEEAICDLAVEDPGGGSIPESGLKRVRTGTRDRSGGSRIEHGLKLRSSYRHLQPDGRPEITTFHSRTALTVDYILYSPVFTDATPPRPSGRGLQLMGRLSLVGQEELEEVNGLPNQYLSSDHLPLLARFRLLH
uniref:Angel homolog 2 (Drosophila) n=1 Tax=Oryzias latipes TaxID=8090 RepID=A0A3P9IQL9_ORYLA